MLTTVLSNLLNSTVCRCEVVQTSDNPPNDGHFDITKNLGKQSNVFHVAVIGSELNCVDKKQTDTQATSWFVIGDIDRTCNFELFEKGVGKLWDSV